MQGLILGWDPAQTNTATDNGDGTWSYTLNPAPEANRIQMGYQWYTRGSFG